MYQNTTCLMCGKDVDIQSHALACQIVAQHSTKEENKSPTNIVNHDIFGNLDQQVAITKICNKIIIIKQKQILCQ